MTNRKKTLILVLCYLAYASIYIARLNLSVSSPEFVGLGLLDKAQLGLIGSVFSVVYAIGRVVNGYIGDKKSPRFMIAAGLALVGISNVVIGLLPAFYSILILWSCNAYAQSMLWSAVLRVVVALYDEATAKKKTSLLVTSVATGNILGILMNTYLTERFGLRFAFFIPGALALAFAFLTLWMGIRETPSKLKNGAHLSFFALLRDREIGRVTLPAMIHGVLKENVSLWMTLFFAERYGIDLSEAMGFVLFIPAVGFAGRAAYPLFYRLCGLREHRVSFGCFCACVPAAAILALAKPSPLVAMVCLGLIYAASSVANTSFLSIFPLRYAETGNVSSASGLMDFVTYLGGGIGSLLYGVLNENYGYSPMFLSWLFLSFAAGALLLFRRKERQKQ